jgi:hypothetical protein
MEEVKKHETFKDVTIAGRNWRVKKFDALTGSYIAYTLLNLALPPMFAKMLAGSIPLVSDTPSGRMMTKQEFMDFQKDCLKICFEVLPAGEAPVIDDNGNWGIDGIENDLATVLTLTVHVLGFNVASFFGEGPWAALVPDPSTTNQ